MNELTTGEHLRNAFVRLNAERREHKREIKDLTDRLESQDRQWSKTIDELERLKNIPEVHNAIYGIK